MADSISFLRKSGASIAEVFDGLAQLRITVFREFPYLYEGEVAYERDYLQTYFQSQRSFLFAVYDNGHMVGATTAIPLADETEEVRKPFLENGYDVDSIFYFGESVLLPEYRGRGLGNLFFDEREAHALSFGQYDKTCFCAVDRPTDHPQRPTDYKPLDEFWKKRGYQQVPELKSWFSWKDAGYSETTAKPMTYWLHNWPL